MSRLWFGPDGTRHRMVALTLALIAVAYLDRVCIATAAPTIKAELGLSDWQMGVVFSAFTFAYALFEIPSGWFADRFGARLTLTRIVLWWSAMTAATGLATGFASLVALRFLFGIGEAGAFPATARAYVRWLPVRERGRAFGLAIMTGAVAGALTQPLVVVLLGRITWHQAFAVFGSVGVVWAAVWWWWFRDDPRDHPGVSREELTLMRSGGAEDRPHERFEWRLLGSSRSLAVLCAMYFCAIYGWYFYLTWLPTYLLRARGFDLKQAGWLAALPLLSIALGVLLGGWLSDRLAARLGVRMGRSLCGVVGLPIAAAAILGGIATTDPVSSALLLALAGGAAALGVAPAWAVSLEIGGIHAGVVSGAMNMCGNLGGTLSPLVIGFALERWGSWEAPLVSVAVLYLAAAVCWLAIDPSDRLSQS